MNGRNPEQVSASQDKLLLEPLNDSAGFFIRADRLLESGHSTYQQYEVWDTPHYGRLFRLDGCCMTSEQDEFFYHENLIHVPGITHPGLRRALIIGGGDGGSARQLLKYRTLEKIVLVELDEKVLEIARTYFQAVHQGSLDDPRVTVHCTDGRKYVQNLSQAGEETFDLLVLDLTDPVGPAETLYTQDFFQLCKTILTEQGSIVLHIGAPFFQPLLVQRILADLRACFKQVAPYFMHIPLYGSLWGMACASDTLNPSSLSISEASARITQRGLEKLSYYNAEVHSAQFALPEYLKKLLA